MLRRKKNIAPERILVFRIGSLGDILIAMPSFWRLRQAYPESELILLSGTSPDNAKMISATAILPKSGLFDGYLTYPDAASPAEAAKMLLEVYKSKAETMVYLMPRTRSANAIWRDRFAFRLAGIRHFIGMQHLSGNLLPVNASYPAEKVSRESDFLWDCLTADEVPGDDWPRRADIGILSGEKQSAVAFLAENYGSNIDGRLMLAVAPGSKWASKIWPAERFAAVLSELRKIYPIVPVIVGDRYDFETGEQILKRLGDGINAAGRLDIRTTAAVLQMCAMYLGNDTGAMHLAASVGTSCVAIFAAIDWPGRWYPIGDGHAVIRKQVECEGCHAPNCPYENRCLQMIEPEEVINACKEILSRITN
ncbi:MAG: glycosyltransferase family 9 protein [Acidobacteriota bacterium]